MKLLFRLAAVAGLALGPWAAPRPASAANLDTTADRVFGQPNFTSGTANNGGLSAASLDLPNGVALDQQGNLYVADRFNHRVLEYDAPLTTGATADRVFGQPNFTANSSNNGGLDAGSLSFPSRVALDKQGNLYVTDEGNHRVLVYDSPLTTDAIADRVFGQPNFTSGTANNGGLTATSLNGPQDMTLDQAGNLYVADYENSRVLVYAAPQSSGMVASHVLGQPNFASGTENNGGLSASSLFYPASVALDAQGNLYVADSANSRVLVYDSPLTTDATADHVFGQPNFTSDTQNNGGLSANSLFSPASVVLDAQGNLYVADSVNNRVLQYDTPLTTNTTADRVFGQPNFTSGTANNGGRSATSLDGPSAVALDAQGNLYVADGGFSGNNRVLGYDVPVAHAAPTLASIGPTTVAAGSPDLALTVNGANFVGGSVVRLNGSPRPTAYVNSTRLIATLSAADVAAGGPFAVTVFTPAPGGGTTALTNLPLYARAGHDPVADVVQGQPNFISNTQNNPVLTGAQRLIFPKGVAVDPHSGRLFVADQANHRVLGWPNAPAFANGQPADLVLGQPNFDSGTANAGGLSANSLSGPAAVALDALGNLYVADNGNHRVLVYEAPLSSGMAASRVFGQGGSYTTALANNGGLGANSLSFPAGVALDAAGNVYVADLGNHRVLQYDSPLSSGTTADRVFGQPNFTTNTANNGGLSAASLNGPQGVAVDQLGRLYVADQFNNRVLAYDNPLSTDRTADQVFGQPDFASGAVNNGGVSADSLFFPFGVALDVFGTLYVADTFNSRVLAYDRPPATDSTADLVFGQPDFTGNTFNNGGLSATSLFQPFSVALDRRGSLFVSDSGNNRLLVYDPQLFSLMLPLIVR